MLRFRGNSSSTSLMAPNPLYERRISCSASVAVRPSFSRTNAVRIASILRRRCSVLLYAIVEQILYRPNQFGVEALIRGRRTEIIV